MNNPFIIFNKKNYLKYGIFIIIILFSGIINANEKAIINALSLIGIDEEEMQIRYDLIERDSNSLNLIYNVLDKPYENEIIAINIKKLIVDNKITNLYKYFQTGKIEKKKNFLFSFLKKDKKVNIYQIMLNEFKKNHHINMDFILDTLISDSILYESSYLFSKSQYNIDEYLVVMQQILQMNENELRIFADSISRIKEVIIFDSLSNTINDSIKIIIDYGGDDIYYLKNENVIIIDFGGNDIYIGESDYAVACGNNGISFIIDVQGNDVYQGKNFSLGCGINGIGFINDRNGNDIYMGSFSTIGAGFSGVGAIIDDNGNDNYLSNGYSQGFGFIKGIGYIYDNNGNDNYTVYDGIVDHREEDYHAHLSQGFGFGIRDITSGGAGIIIDINGNDNYTGEYFVQGSSYWFAYGLIYDENGNDNYKARRYSQGAGTHYTTGILIDFAGDDNYLSWGVSQGCGHDFAIGMLTDYNGSDKYVSEWLSQGAGNANGIGILFDFEGNNIINNIKTSCGYSDYSRDMYSIGILYLMDGNTNINGAKAETRINNKWGFIINEE